MILSMNPLHRFPTSKGTSLLRTQLLRNAPKTFHFHDIPTYGTSSPHALSNKKTGPLRAYWVRPKTNVPLLCEFCKFVNMGSD